MQKKSIRNYVPRALKHYQDDVAHYVFENIAYITVSTHHILRLTVLVPSIWRNSTNADKTDI